MDKYYAINKLFLSRIGCWPYQRKVLLLYKTWGDIDIAVECMISMAFVFVGSTKLLNIAINNNKFRQLLQLMNKHWEIFNGEDERNILSYYACISLKIAKYYGGYILISLILYLFIPLVPRILDIVVPLNESRPLVYVFQGEYGVDKEKYYFLIVLHSYIASLNTITAVFTVDITYIASVLHACSLFAAISHRLNSLNGQEEIKTGDEKKTHIVAHNHSLRDEDISISNDHYKLIICLKKHQFALEHVQILNSIFTKATFILLSLNVLMLSVVGIQVLNNATHTDEIIRYAFLAYGTFLHLIFMCIPGQLLIDRSTEVFEKAYAAAWYTFSVKTKRLLSILLYRSFVPCTLTAGKMFVMSMTMCSSVTQTAMSYFTAFLSIR
ncbi:hypothetical protein PUN28_006850 [Cardiocondyla obscurior]|uniref:Odorant receptor n=1 Tax=Cardiocondyla obscurior TaxID=286306 RepID=A0AAW2G228_9HYME